MASEKISQLTPHTPNSSDVIPVELGGTNFSDTVGQIETAAAALVHWSTLLGDLAETQVIPFDGGTPGTADTGISRLGAASLAIGNGTAGDTTGDLVFTNADYGNSMVVGGGAAQSPQLSFYKPGQTVASQQPWAYVGSNGEFATGAWITVSPVNNGRTGPEYGILPPTNDYTMMSVWPDVNGPDLLLSQNPWGGAPKGSFIWGINQQTYQGTATYIFSISGQGGTVQWASPLNTSSAGWDTSLSRNAAGSLCIGNGTFGDVSGTLQTSSLIAGTLDVSSIVAFTTPTTSSLTSSFAVAPTDGSRNNDTGCSGMTFQVLNTITVSKLGRRYAAGNSNNHNVNLWAQSNQVTPLATGTILAASSADGQGIKWVSITPVILTPGNYYTLAIDETNGGDVWNDLWAPSLQSYIVNYSGVYGSTGAYPGSFTADTGNQIYNTPAMDFTYTTPTADSGISRLGAASIALGNGTQGDTSGNISAMTHTVTASSGAPTSAGTAGTIGQIIAYGGFLYYCSVTGGAGSATWNKLTMTAV